MDQADMTQEDLGLLEKLEAKTCDSCEQLESLQACQPTPRSCSINISNRQALIFELAQVKLLTLFNIAHQESRLSAYPLGPCVDSNLSNVVTLALIPHLQGSWQ